jgi:hypothetical protein
LAEFVNDAPGIRAYLEAKHARRAINRIRMGKDAHHAYALSVWADGGPVSLALMFAHHEVHEDPSLKPWEVSVE